MGVRIPSGASQSSPLPAVIDSYRAAATSRKAVHDCGTYSGRLGLGMVVLKRGRLVDAALSAAQPFSPRCSIPPVLVPARCPAGYLSRVHLTASHVSVSRTPATLMISCPTSFLCSLHRTLGTPAAQSCPTISRCAVRLCSLKDGRFTYACPFEFLWLSFRNLAEVLCFGQEA